MVKIGPYYWVRVAVMVITLVGVVTVMKRFSVVKPSESSVDLCPTRVSSMSVVGRFAVLQDGMKWYRAEGGERKELDSIAVEKWFSEYCKLESKTVEKAEGQTPLLTLDYVSGDPKTLNMTPDGIFTWEGRTFSSPELASAISALELLPISKKPGENKGH